jgi:Fe-S cluster assembly iron-binding protein IscA
VVEAKGVRVLIDPSAMMHVLGARMDYVEDKLK